MIILPAVLLSKTRGTEKKTMRKSQPSSSCLAFLSSFGHNCITSFQITTEFNHGTLEIVCDFWDANATKTNDRRRRHTKTYKTNKHTVRTQREIYIYLCGIKYDRMESVFCHYSSTSQSFKSENAEVHCMPQVMIAHPHKKRVYIPKAHYHSLTHSLTQKGKRNERVLPFCGNASLNHKKTKLLKTKSILTVYNYIIALVVLSLYSLLVQFYFSCAPEQKNNRTNYDYVRLTQ